MGVVLCKDFWNSDRGKSMCYILIFCFVKWRNGVKEIWSCDLCGFEDFEKRSQWAQKNEIRTIWPLENLKPLYDVEGDFFASFWTEFRWPLTWASVKFGECIWCSIYTCFEFCLFVTLFFGDNMLFFPYRKSFLCKLFKYTLCPQISTLAISLGQKW
jgi:hypothetical protein